MRRVTIRVYYRGEWSQAHAACEALTAEGIHAIVESTGGQYGSILRVDEADRDRARQVLANRPDEAGLDIEEVEAQEAVASVGWWSGPALFMGSIFLTIGGFAFIVIYLKQDVVPFRTSLLFALFFMTGVVMMLLGQRGRKKRQAVRSDKVGHPGTLTDE